MEILKITNINKSYKLNKETTKILKDINLKFYKGEIVSILGESGSGKSTLLNIIGGIDSEYSGELYFEGKLLKDNYDVYRKPNEISGGQKQRVAIARAIMNNPRILICDEPTGALDSQNSIEILNIFKELAITGKTIIIATHSDEVSNISHRQIRLKDGKIEKEEVLNDFLEYYEEKEVNKPNRKISLISSMFLSYHNTKQKLFRNILISFGASIGIMGLLIMMSLSNSVKTYINNTIKTSKNSNIVDIYKEKQSNNQLFSEAFNYEDINKIKKMKYIENIYYGYSKNENYNIRINSEIHNFDIINTFSKLMNKDLLLKGNFPKEGEVLLNYYFFEDIDKDITESSIVFQDKLFNVSGIYEDGIKEKTIYLNYNDINNLFGVEPNALYLESNNVNKLKTNILNEGLFLSYLEDSLKIFNDTFDVIIYILSFGSFLSLLISSIMITVVLYISVLERTKEIGIFRALGINKREIKKIFISDGVLFGIISGLMGITFSFIILKLTDYVIFKTFFIEISSININYIIIVFLLSVVLSSISSLYPASKASKLNIIDSLRYE